eukprot:7232077-Pyramimonas_sp.AAC.1
MLAAPGPGILGQLCGAGIDVQELAALGREVPLELALSAMSPPAHPGALACQRCADAAGVAVTRRCVGLPGGASEPGDPSQLRSLLGGG